MSLARRSQAGMTLIESQRHGAGCELFLVEGVQSLGRLVQQQDFGLEEQHLGQRRLLQLTAGQIEPAPMLEAVAKSVDTAIAQGRF